MKKANKVLLIIFCVLIAVAAVTVGIFYGLYPVQTKEYILMTWNWLNKPLPVVGVSTLMILFFAWKVFANSSFGKKQINELKTELENVNRATKNERLSLETQIAYLEREIEQLRQDVETEKRVSAEAYAVSPNKKIRAIGVKYYGERKETINNETTTD